MKLHQWILFVCLVLICPIYPVFSDSADDEAKRASVFPYSVKATELFDLLTYPARVIPKINTTLLSEIDGVISSIKTPLGQKVVAGQKLMTISHTDPVYHYAPLTVVSPVAGVVSLVEVSEGSHVVKGQKLASVTDPTQTRITIEVPAQDLFQFKQGMVGTFKLAEQEANLSVRVRGVSPYVDPSTGTATAELELIQKKVSITPLPGLIGQVTFKTNVHSGISIPDHAIFYKGNDTYVRVLEKNKVKQVLVKIGKKQRGFVEILKGLAPNWIIAERTSRFIADGETVQIEESP